MAVDELQVARLERHLEAQFLRGLHQHVDRLALGVGELRHPGCHLRRLDEGQRIVRGELAVAQAEDRQRVGGLARRRLAVLLGAFLAEAAAPVVLEQQLEEVGPPLENGVMDGRRGGELADAAGARLANAQKADHVSAVGMESQPAIGQRAGIGGEEGRTLLVLGLAVGAADMGALVADRAHQLAAAILEDRRPDMRADREVEAAQVIFRIAIDRNAAQLDDAATVLEFVGDVVEQFVERGQVEVFPCDLLPRHAAETLESRVEFIDAIGSQFANPA